MPKTTPEQSGGVSGGARVKGAGRVSFLAHKDHIRAEAEAGWPRKTIWQRLEKSLDGMSYSQFCRYANRYLGDIFNDHEPSVPGPRSGAVTGNGNRVVPATTRAEGAPPAQRPAADRTERAGGIRTFRHSTDTDPNDLIG